MADECRDKVALVTGASRGIGAAIVAVNALAPVAAVLTLDGRAVYQPPASPAR